MFDIDMRQSVFATAILHPESSIPPGLIGPDGEPSARRFAVYRNNVVAGLCAALKASYPATCRMVGEEFFAATARAYVLREPPHSPVMLDYGRGFAGFVGAFEPAQSLPYLRDVAQLERAHVDAYHAREAVSLDAIAFRLVEPGELPSVRLALHPSVRTVRSRFPVVTLWQMNIEGGVPAFVDVESGGEDAFVARPAAEVKVRTLPRGAASFIEALQGGGRVIDALEFALADEPSFDLGGTLKFLIEIGAITNVQVDDNAERLV